MYQYSIQICSLFLRAYKKRKLDHVAVISVATAAEHMNKPVVVFPRRQIHFKTNERSREATTKYLSFCYFYQQNIHGVTSVIVSNRMNEFIKDMENCQTRGQKLLLVMDS